MKTFNFNQTGGFKLITEVLSGLQDAYSIFSGVAKMAGEKAIVSGCEDLGVTVGDGLVVIGGETLEFKGGVKQNTVIIKEENTGATFEDGSIKPFEKYRYATFGYSGTAFNWADFKRVTPLNALEDRITALEKMTAPIRSGGGRMLWCKPANLIPPGWVADDGWEKLAPVGLDPLNPAFDEVGKIGGEEKHTLTIGELPQHRFKLFGYGGINSPRLIDNPNGVASVVGDSPIDNEDWNYSITSASGDAGIGNTNELGAGMPHNNMSPYRIVIYIKYVG
ncbi:hypothetical protein [Chryseobacterium herbae]|uniref:Tail fiber protein n=1 Tax=Chryseobacterium herbae TaxID=2976476 RepID=A0ABT2IYN1_9FLAO|nr:hypothetical protein [Chryseobacterium sp. pc1-10]MCT2563940.1 hypothetical protein [Chryseobacterium sp. pc1-10]